MPHNTGKGKITEEVKSKIFELRNRGFSQRKIGKTIGLWQSEVARTLAHNQNKKSKIIKTA